MLIRMKRDASARETNDVDARIRERGADARRVDDALVVIHGKLRADDVARMPGVESVEELSTPYRLVARAVRPRGTVVTIGDVEVGAGALVVAAGPCSVESRGQILETAHAVAAAGATLLRGGAFKPRTSPYAFQGLGEEGLELLAEAGIEAGLPVVTEVMSPEDVPLVARWADVMQVGARNVQNFALLKALGATRRPVLLKRGMSTTVEELLLAAEYVVAHGNSQVILCERGIRTFETSTRNTLDLGAVAALAGLTHLPVIVDPSHGTGRRDLVGKMAKASVAVGADGLIVEVHPDPASARSDGAQSLDLPQFAALMGELHAHASLAGRTLGPRGGMRGAGGVEDLRKRIDGVDARIVQLLHERAALALDVGRLKRAAGVPVRVPAREAEVIARARQLAHGALPPDAVERVFEAIVSGTRTAEERDVA